ncbi:MAG TPA: YggT family protein [bacterium]|nr:YggT family protein [bacterium]
MLASNLVWAVGQLVHTLLTVYMWMFIISALLSWVQPNPYNPIIRFLRRVTEPLLFRLRQRLPFLWQSGVDFSPMVVILALYTADLFLTSSFQMAANRLLAGVAW